mmetsp:Transcript_34261/g.91495  ORF Transcript_34261/g.91495 Transcript_34261/m.91495 type:complete len:314 (+) Transcript_34261:250-1191(+)
MKGLDATWHGPCAAKPSPSTAFPTLVLLDLASSFTASCLVVPVVPAPGIPRVVVPRGAPVPRVVVTGITSVLLFAVSLAACVGLLPATAFVFTFSLALHLLLALALRLFLGFLLFLFHLLLFLLVFLVAFLVLAKTLAFDFGLAASTASRQLLSVKLLDESLIDGRLVSYIRGVELLLGEVELCEWQTPSVNHLVEPLFQRLKLVHHHLLPDSGDLMQTLETKLEDFHDSQGFGQSVPGCRDLDVWFTHLVKNPRGEGNAPSHAASRCDPDLIVRFHERLAWLRHPAVFVHGATEPKPGLPREQREPHPHTEN